MLAAAAACYRRGSGRVKIATLEIVQKRNKREGDVPGFYDKAGLRFAYPDNWTIDDDDQSSADAAVTVLSPATAFWTVMLYHRQLDVRELADAVLEALQSEYPQTEVDTTEATAEAHAYELSFQCLDLINTAFIRAFQHGEQTYLVLSQAEDHELEVAEQVFDAMAASLLQPAE